MGSSPPPPPAQRSHFGDFVQRFAWACLLRPPGTKMLDDAASSSFSDFDEEEEVVGGESFHKMGKSNGGGDKVKSKCSSAKEEADDYFHEAESEYFRDDSGGGVDKLACSSSSSSDIKIQALEGFIGDVFATVSSLKSAYVQLQAAHSPFDPEKLRQADKAVIMELRRLSEMKHCFKEGSKARRGRDREVEMLRQRVQELLTASSVKQRAIDGYEQRARAFEREIAELNSEVASLRESLRRAASRRDKLERKLMKNSNSSARRAEQQQHHPAPPPPPDAPTTEIFEEAVRGAREAGLSFVKLLVSLMRSAGWDLEAAAESIEASITYARAAHRRFAFESYASARAFCGFENENFYINGSLSSILDPAKHRAECLAQFRDMRGVDPGELLGITPDCLFGKFCHRKYIQIVHEKMEDSFFGGSSQHRDIVLAGGHPRTSFYNSFLKFAKAVWLVHRLAFAMDPPASIFQVRRGTEFDPTFMESATKHVRMSDDDDGVRPKVGFTVMPGFRIGSNWAVKCIVYLDSMVASDD